MRTRIVWTLTSTVAGAINTDVINANIMIPGTLIVHVIKCIVADTSGVTMNDVSLGSWRLTWSWRDAAWHGIGRYLVRDVFFGRRDVAAE